MSLHRYPAQADSSDVISKYADFASFPGTEEDGVLAIALDTNTLYEFDTADGSWHAIGAAGFVNTVADSNSIDHTLSAAGELSSALRLSSTAATASFHKATTTVKTSGSVGLHVEIEHAATGQTGVLTAADWNTFNGKQNAITGAASSVTSSDLAVSRAVVSDGSGKIAAATTTADEIGYVNGVTSAIQTQLDAKLAKAGGTMTGDLVLVGDPDSALKAATKQYVDAIANGLKWKQAVRVATTGAGTLATSFENGDTVDGVVLATGDRILLKNQASASENGIYTVAASGAPARASDADAFGELNSAVVMVSEGTANADKGFIQTVTLTALSDGQTWVQNFGTGLYGADGNGLELSGSTFALELDGGTLSKGSSGLKVADGGVGATQLASAVLSLNSVVAISSNVALTNKALHLVDTSSARSLTLPAPATTLFLVIKDKTGSAASNNITLVRPGAQNIETVAASFALDIGLGSWTVVSDGTDYFVI